MRFAAPTLSAKFGMVFVGDRAAADAIARAAARAATRASMASRPAVEAPPKAGGDRSVGAARDVTF